MSPFARVGSIDALKALRGALCKFAETAKAALLEVDWEIQRTADWLERDQQAYWKGQVRKRGELVAQAKLALTHKQLQKMPGGGRYSCVEEKQALAAAKRRLEEAEHKLANVQRWAARLKQEAADYKSMIQPMARAVEAEIPQAVGKLESMLASLEAYASVSGETGAGPTAGAAVGDGGAVDTTESMARAAGPPAERQTLREMTPNADVLEKAPVVAVEPGAVRMVQITTDDREKIEERTGEAGDTGNEDTVVLAQDVWAYRRIYLVRVTTPGGHCRAYVGPADGTKPEVYEAVRASELLAGRPQWRELMRLGEGCLVILNGEAVEAILGPGEDSVGRAEDGR